MPQPIERFHYGQGEVLAARWSGDTPPAANAWKKLWDVSALSVALARESFTHKESRSGKKMEVRDISNGESGTVKATIAAINTHNLALLLSSSVVDIAVGSISAEALPTGIVAGDVILLDHVGISDLVVTDSAGTSQTANISIAVAAAPTPPAPPPPPAPVPAPLSINLSGCGSDVNVPCALPGATSNTSYAYIFSASGGDTSKPLVWTYTNLPGGLTGGAVSGALTGTAPTVAACTTYNFVVTATRDSATVSRTVSLGVCP